ncbi:hypothetical protein RJT34_18502 [Clitoria ternatea]|uniref:Uncharacterized protein n=1 Tax=Clitoria ternatea TaxID=43366 RepID=A0AAN9PFW6_CLITE
MVTQLRFSVILQIAFCWLPSKNELIFIYVLEMMGLGRLVVTLKSKIKCLKVKQANYDKMEKSESMRVEIRSRKAKKLIEETLKIADSPKSRTFTF